MASDERIYFVIYDIGDARRWRAVFKTMHGYGDWVQLSAFQCRLTAVRHAELIADLDELIHQGEDHVVILDVGAADKVQPRVVSLGKRPYTPMEPWFSPAFCGGLIEANDKRRHLLVL